ncbi:hypothetical protein ACWCQW_46985 [Streptomyces mirabilis]
MTSSIRHPGAFVEQDGDAFVEQDGGWLFAERGLMADRTGTRPSVAWF